MLQDSLDLDPSFYQRDISCSARVKETPQKMDRYMWSWFQYFYIFNCLPKDAIDGYNKVAVDLGLKLLLLIASDGTQNCGHKASRKPYRKMISCWIPWVVHLQETELVNIFFADFKIFIKKWKSLFCFGKRCNRFFF